MSSCPQSLFFGGVFPLLAFSLSSGGGLFGQVSAVGLPGQLPSFSWALQVSSAFRRFLGSVWRTRQVGFQAVHLQKSSSLARRRQKPVLGRGWWFCNLILLPNIACTGRSGALPSAPGDSVPMAGSASGHSLRHIPRPPVTLAVGRFR